MQKQFLFLWLFIGVRLAFAQAPELNVPSAKYTTPTWKAKWITHPDLSGGEHAVVLFRKKFSLIDHPQQFIISISADNHYRLYVNGKKVGFGPQLSDIRHWRYETIDIAPFLQAGENVLAAEVINWGYFRFFGMQSVHTGLVINGFSEKEQIVNTQGGTWKTFWNKALHEKPVHWRVANPDIIGGFYACNPTDSLVAADYPWDWEQLNFNDAAWKESLFLENASAFGGSFGWVLEPRNVPQQSQTEERLSKIARTEGIQVTPAFLEGKSSLLIPANAKVSILIDQTFLTTGYPELKFSGGHNARIKISYAENLFNPDKSKGDRNDITGKKLVGYQDVILADGGQNRHFQPSWLRTFRFVQIDVNTQNEPLSLDDFFNHKTLSSIPVKAKFSADSPMYGKIFDLCHRTVELCTQDYFLSDAYYETMQYLGDSKVHIPVWQSMTGNDWHTRNALQQFHYSRLPDGNLTSCYPLKSTFVHPTYSVIWVDMVYDYLKYSGDKAYTQQFLSGIQQTLAGFDALIQPNGLAGPTSWNYFVDWYVESTQGGLGPGHKGVNSAVVTLHYVHALQSAAKIFQTFGRSAEATQYLTRANFIKNKVYEQCFDAKRGIFAERPDKSFYDQHTNILAVLTDAAPVSLHKSILNKILSEEDISPATYYYRYYLFEAIHKAQVPELFELAQKPWEELVNLNLTTALERFESGKKATRSECHPWSTAPAYFYFKTIAGIEPTGLGFSTIKIAPKLGKNNKVEGLYPTPFGEINFKISRQSGGGVQAELNIPSQIKGQFIWAGKTVPLKPGPQQINLD
ncbi:MAG: alpha-L-rhamnosidase N-terminal domain-containing protein [Haliscomenobacter sp.]|uniref:alpha-L-rhamnosidase-related protein n=1 Tax=Haliscomenobacter sp. TaxID=2717303 RepID=UPI0029B98327|nr:alpha-L-rhamnosidase N-terminal domain-containing protein [Haliscomenobacter sp.]MDX2070525.1 alpha-L-rhamnosidase N-terminal domain-containing protein [Haliscomenobacter sp.]